MRVAAILAVPSSSNAPRYSAAVTRADPREPQPRCLVPEARCVASVLDRTRISSRRPGQYSRGSARRLDHRPNRDLCCASVGSDPTALCLALHRQCRHPGQGRRRDHRRGRRRGQTHSAMKCSSSMATPRLDGGDCRRARRAVFQDGGRGKGEALVWRSRRPSWTSWCSSTRTAHTNPRTSRRWSSRSKRAGPISSSRRAAKAAATSCTAPSSSSCDMSARS